jgi:hypothetical protein
MKRRLASLVVLSVLAATGCGGEGPRSEPDVVPTSSTADTFQVVGRLSLSLPDFTWNEDPLSCAGSGGYNDLALGAQVVVSDPAGTTVAVGSVIEAIPIVERDDDTAEYRASACTLRFVVSGVPTGKTFYGVEVSHRGRLQYPEAEARKELELTIGLLNGAAVMLGG